MQTLECIWQLPSHSQCQIAADSGTDMAKNHSEAGTQKNSAINADADAVLGNAVKAMLGY